MDINSKIQEAGQVFLHDEDVIDFQSAIPFYYQLQLYLETKIKSDVWKSGQQLPSENELCEHFNVSRTVVRKALGELSSNNLIETVKGKGRFVSSNKYTWRLMAGLNNGFCEDAIACGKKVNTQVLEQKDLPASEEIAQYLKLTAGETVTKLKRLRFADGEPMVVVSTYIPKKICPDLVDEDFKNRSLYAYLREECRLEMTEGIRTIESVNASLELAHLLRVEEGAALSLLRSIGWLSDGTPLEYYVAWHRGDRCQFTVKLVSGSQWTN